VKLDQAQDKKYDLPCSAGIWMTVLYLYRFRIRLNAGIMEREDTERNCKEIFDDAARLHVIRVS